MKKTIDCMGMACPLPVVNAKKAFADFTEDGELTVLVDNETAVSNLKKLAASSGFAAEGVHTAQVTFAARDSEMRGERIKKGQILGMEDGKITLVDNNMIDVAFRVTRRLVKKYNGTLVTVFYGEETDEAAANELGDRLQARFPGAEINVINGGQPVYYFILSVE